MFHKYNDAYVEYISKVQDLRPIYPQISSMVMKVHSNKFNRNMTDEIVQTLQFQLLNYKTWLLTSSADNRVYLIWNNFKKVIPYHDMGKYFSKDEIDFELCAPINKSIERFCSILEKSIPLNDNQAFLGLKRMRRESNIFFIYSSNTSYQINTSKLLQSYGNVITVSSKEELISLYQQYVPNVLFIDDLQNGELKETIHDVRSVLDTYCKIVIVSKKSDESHVKSLLKLGISGYLLLPLSSKAIFIQLSRLNLLKNRA